MKTSISDKKIHSAIKEYLKSLSELYATSNATELSYRTAFQNFLQAVLPEATVINEPKHIECGAPDFLLNYNGIPRGYIETKDLNNNLDDKSFKEQFSRYSKSLDNLIFTNYLEFRLVIDDKLSSTVIIGTVSRGKIKPTQQHFDDLVELLNTFWGYQGQTIKSANSLVKHMAAKARMLAVVIAKALEQDELDIELAYDYAETGTELQIQFNLFKERLINDLEPETFADIYAQTIAYGFFCARLHDPTPETFTRGEAAVLIPESNPFLRKFFQDIAGFDLDTRISWLVDDLANLFSATNVGELMEDYGKATQHNDPFLHFYETFLGQYKPELRKSRGVYYTPESVVNFIVRAADEILRIRFDLPRGLADSSKTSIEVEVTVPEGKIKKRKKEIHKVQILDPATGTGTFLSNIVHFIHKKQSADQDGMWDKYVLSHLLPRLSGFEVLMASYAMAHTKLEMVLRDTGCEVGNNRLRIFLTNSLEEFGHDHGTVSAKWLADEAKVASSIKRDTPVMVVIGNPPYSGKSVNNGKWITDLLQDYKKEPGGGRLREPNPKWLNDDYVKFIRFGQYHIDRTGEGVLAYINNHSYLDNPTFRGMRWSILKSFDVIYIIDLHGSSIKKEIAPNGKVDKNVFDIKQGVSINLFVKTGEKQKDEIAKVFHYDLYGAREEKYQFLWDHDLNQIEFKELEPEPPQYFFVPTDYSLKDEYDQGFSLAKLFPIYSAGIVTARDDFTIYDTPQELKTKITNFLGMSDEDAISEFSLRDDTQDWKVAYARKDLENFFPKDKKGKRNIDTTKLMPISYRPFDTRYTVYTGKSNGFHCRPRGEVMQHFINVHDMSENIGLTLCKQFKSFNRYQHIFITNNIFESSLVSNKTSEICSGFPLYRYPDAVQHHIESWRMPNLEQNIVDSIAKGLGLEYTYEKQGDDSSFAPIDILDYIYAVLHSPSYRERYKEFLKTDFPKVPYPADKELFWKLVKLGGELRTLHLMENPALEQWCTSYKIKGSDTVKKPEFKTDAPNDSTGNVYINKEQYFGNVPRIAWEFYIGGYQPAQKWLKDRKGQILTIDDVDHYQRIIVALKRTGDIMFEIDALPVIN